MTRSLTAPLAAAIALVLTAGIVAAVEGSGGTSAEPPAARAAARAAALHPAQVGAAAAIDAEVDVKVTIPLPGTTTSAPGPATTTTSTTPFTATTTPSQSTTAAGPPTSLSPVPPSVPATIVVPSSWSSRSDGTAVDARMTPVSPKAGQAVTFVFEYSSEYPCCDLLVDFGDGSGFSHDAGVTCPEEPPRQPGSRRTQTTHTYTAPGVYTLSVGVVAHARCVFPFPTFHGTSVSGAVVVTA